MRLKALGRTRITSAPCGSAILLDNGTIIFKTEYNDDSHYPECYIFGSGERYCGEFNINGMVLDLDVYLENED